MHIQYARNFLLLSALINWLDLCELFQCLLDTISVPDLTLTNSVRFNHDKYSWLNISFSLVFSASSSAEGQGHTKDSGQVIERPQPHLHLGLGLHGCWHIERLGHEGGHQAEVYNLQICPLRGGGNNIRTFGQKMGRNICTWRFFYKYW